jgi:hypothetical protein
MNQMEKKIGELENEDCPLSQIIMPRGEKREWRKIRGLAVAAGKVS